MALEHHILGNGVQVIRQFEKSADRFTIGFGARMGIEKEVRYQLGATHAAEHMLMNGRTNAATRVFIDDRRKRNIEVNGTTAYDYSYACFSGYPSQRQRVASMAFESYTRPFGAIEYARERNVLKTEMGNYAYDPSELMDAQLYKTLYPNTRYATHWIDAVARIDRLTLHTVQSYKNYLFRPSNLTVVVISPHDDKKIDNFIIDTFGSLQSTPALRPYKYELPTHKPSFEIIPCDTTGQSHVNFVLPFSIANMSARRMAAAQVTAELLEHAVFSELRYKRGLIYDLVATAFCSRPEGRLDLTFECQPEDLEEAWSATKSKLRMLRTTLADISVLRAAKRDALASFKECTRDDEPERSEWYMSNNANGLLISTDEYETALKKVTCEEVRSLFSEGLDGLTVLATLPRRLFRAHAKPLTERLIA